MKSGHPVPRGLRVTIFVLDDGYLDPRDTVEQSDEDIRCNSSCLSLLWCLGIFFVLLLSNPEKVQRDDGTVIEAPRGIKWRTEGEEI